MKCGSPVPPSVFECEEGAKPGRIPRTLARGSLGERTAPAHSAMVGRVENIEDLREIEEKL
jgi:hypothetical protein